MQAREYNDIILEKTRGHGDKTVNDTCFPISVPNYLHCSNEFILISGFIKYSKNKGSQSLLFTIKNTI